MRKLVAAPLFVAFFGLGAAQAAPEAAKCPKDAMGKTKFDPKDPTTLNCFNDEIFVLNGAETVMVGNPAVAAPLVDCADKSGMAGVKDSKNCLFGTDASEYLKVSAVERAAQKAVELIRMKGGTGEWDEVVVFTADFGPTTATGPLFYRATNGMAQPINEVAGIGLGAPIARDAAKPYIGIINAGNTKSLPANPATGAYGPCGSAPRRPAIDDPSAQPAAALCAPGLYTYFDSLAQATANIYGPYLKVDPMAHGGDLPSMPAIKSTLVGLANNVVSAKIMGGPATNVWNAFVNTRGSLLGGNTFADNGNGTWSVARPPVYQGVTAPFEGAQVLRFTPMDLYAMGLLPSTAVGPLQSFMHAGPGNVYQPAGITGFNANVGPAMGTRFAGVSIRGNGGARPVPKLINFGDVVTASGGERTPGFAQANQYIRQLWVMVAKPQALIDLTAADGGAKAEDQIKDQATQLTNLQRTRRSWMQSFYALTGYRGRVYTTGDGGNVDDNAYWEFGGARDDAATFTANGLQVQINGAEEVPNSGGKQVTVLRVTNTDGKGSIRFNKGMHNIRIDGNQNIGSAPYNVLTIRMRAQSDPGLLANLKKDPLFENGFYGTFIFEGGGKSLSVNIPESEAAFIVPDGKFRTYSALLSNKDAFKTNVWDSFTFIPSTRPTQGLEIEFIKVGWVDSPKDADKSCDDKDQADGWIDNVEDNCPKLYNPAQEDGNNDGIGDACEDYDGDNKLNSCDNCPTVTNTSQRDANRNGLGDACDGTKDAGCFFQESAVAGSASPTSALVWATVLVFGVMIGGAIRRRRRR
jgi:hypothetical protein